MSSILLYNALIGGLVFGAIYALIGASLNVMMGVLRVVNFAHGEFVLIGSFLAYSVFSLTGLNPLAALPVVAIAMFFGGVAAYYLLIPRLRYSDDAETSSFLLMFGVSLMLVSSITWIYGADIRPVNFSFDPVNIALLTVEDAYGKGRDGKVLVPTARLVALVINLAIIAAMTWFIYRTLPGKALRGAIMNRDAIQVVGIDIDRLSANAFGLAAALAGVTGVILTLVIPSVDPNGGAPLTLFAFIVIVLGGLGHPIGALLAGMLFGMVEQFSNVLLPQSAAQMVGFVMLVAVVMFKPEGLFGRKVMR
ncbi:branched-chain amino acid ABC transporter permease [Stappia stellulata]|uniref:branched-chain amino acid ABC transporter permease n=1 Tax=Stappia stellulata TaxID=71235 RepID=UPI001CD708DF|nr:branched-chain amino acid ABC transporter permease [Stappia stellulata]MCA1241480.1 branched-chain amino acid ABC transporter permease [Stappia stellulata]